MTSTLYTKQATARTGPLCKAQIKLGTWIAESPSIVRIGQPGDKRKIRLTLHYDYPVYRYIGYAGGSRYPSLPEIRFDVNPKKSWWGYYPSPFLAHIVVTNGNRMVALIRLFRGTVPHLPQHLEMAVKAHNIDFYTINVARVPNDRPSLLTQISVHSQTVIN